jgi:hypothetical protein
MILRDLLGENAFRAELLRQKREQEQAEREQAARKAARRDAYSQGKRLAANITSPYTPVAKGLRKLASWAKQDVKSRSK